MNGDSIQQEIIDAIDEIRWPPGNLLRASMTAVRTGKSLPKSGGVPGVAIAAVMAVMAVGVLIGAASLKHACSSASS